MGDVTKPINTYPFYKRCYLIALYDETDEVLQGIYDNSREFGKAYGLTPQKANYALYWHGKKGKLLLGKFKAHYIKLTPNYIKNLQGGTHK